MAAEFCEGTVRLLQTGLENLPKFYSLERLRQSLDNRTPVGERFVLRPGPSDLRQMHHVFPLYAHKIGTPP